MSSTGYEDPTQGMYAAAAQFSIDVTDQVGEQKLGAVNTLSNSVAGYAVRQKQIAYDLTAATQTAIAHGLVDENGNPATPVAVMFLNQNTATVYSSKAPDSTNIYLTDASATAEAASTGTVVVLY